MIKMIMINDEEKKAYSFPINKKRSRELKTLRREKRKPVLGHCSNIKQGKMLPASEHLMDMYNSES